MMVPWPSQRGFGIWERKASKGIARYRPLFAGTIIAAMLVFCKSGAAQQLYVPRSSDEALHVLRYTQTQEADWRWFNPPSSITFSHRVRKSGEADVDEEVTMELETNTATGRVSFIVAVRGQGRTRVSSQDVYLDEPRLDASEARYLRSEPVSVAGKQYDTKLYRFVFETKAGLSSTLTTTHFYWLTGGIPGGVARHEFRQVESEGGNDTIAAVGSNWLDEINVELSVAGKVLRCYCWKTDVRLRGGGYRRAHICKASELPGGMVKYEVEENENGVLERDEREIIEFSAYGRSP